MAPAPTVERNVGSDARRELGLRNAKDGRVDGRLSQEPSGPRGIGIPANAVSDGLAIVDCLATGFSGYGIEVRARDISICDNDFEAT